MKLKSLNKKFNARLKDKVESLRSKMKQQKKEKGKIRTVQHRINRYFGQKTKTETETVRLLYYFEFSRKMEPVEIYIYKGVGSYD